MFASEIKKIHPGARIIFGGPYVSRFSKRLTNIKWLGEFVAQLAPGEASLVLPKLLGKNEIWSGHVRPYFSDFDLKNYLSPQPVLPYLVSHGCKWEKCVFCTHHLSYSKYRAGDLDKVVSDINFLRNTHGIQHISFCDEYLSARELGKLAVLLKKHNTDIRWSSFVRAEPEFCSQTFTKQLYESGARLLMFGFESASQKILTAMKKGTNSAHYLPILLSCAEANIAVRLDFMLGFPGETVKDIKKTFSFIRKYAKYADTPFSSIVTGPFKVREDTPIMKDLRKYKVEAKARLRGDLDELYDFVDKKGLSNELKLDWRNKVIGYIKKNLSSEVINPQNKTHQLIYKDMYDTKQFVLPPTKLLIGKSHDLYCRLNRSIRILREKRNGTKIIDYASGGEFIMPSFLNRLIVLLEKGVDLDKAYIICKSLGLNTKTSKD